MFSSLCYFINENSVEEKIKREEEILYSPLVKSIKKSKILLSKSFNFDDHYSDTLDWYMMQDTKFTITDNIKKLGIKELTLEKRDFLIT